MYMPNACNSNLAEMIYQSPACSTDQIITSNLSEIWLGISGKSAKGRRRFRRTVFGF